jgi:hypothetical protein
MEQRDMIVNGQHVKGFVEYVANTKGGRDAIVHIPCMPISPEVPEVSN